MASYYYLISSLPDLRTDGEMPFSYEEFLGMCQSNVSESKYECLKNLTLSSEEGPIMKEWAASYKNLMSELNYQRSVNLGRPYLASYDKDSVTAQVAGAALAAKNPLEAEKILLDRTCIDDIDRILDEMVYIQFGQVAAFISMMKAAQAIPHTDLELFPSVQKKLEEKQKEK